MSHSPLPFDMPLKAHPQKYDYIVDRDGISVLRVRWTGNDTRKLYANLEPDGTRMRRYVLEAVNQYEQHEALVAENAALKQRVEELEAELAALQESQP